MYDPLMALLEATGLGRWRRWLARGVAGPVLDVGCGTGRNLALLGPDARAVGLDPCHESLLRARQRAPRALLVRGRAEALPFRAQSFETVVSGLVFCSVEDPGAGLHEVRRVLGAQGSLRMLEHVRSHRPWKARLQDLGQPFWTWLTGGCRPNRETERRVEAAGFQIDRETRRAAGNMRRFVAVPEAVPSGVPESTDEPAPEGQREGAPESRPDTSPENLPEAVLERVPGPRILDYTPSHMPRTVRCGLIQASNVLPPDQNDLGEVREAMVAKHLRLIEEAAGRGVQILCLQELFYGPYFAAEQDTRWYDFTERVPDGPIVRVMQEAARKHGMAMVVPVYEEEGTGVFYNTAAVIDADGSYLGKYRKSHIPHCLPGFWEKFYFKPGNLGYPVFKTRYATIGVYICYDRHFPEGARMLGLHGAEIVFVPSATTSGHSDDLWKIEQPAMAIANGYFVGTNNRVGREAPWNFGEFYGSSYFCDPYGRILSVGSRDRDEVVVADLDLDLIPKVRAHWQFYRDRRPDSYSEIAKDVL